MQMQFLSVKLSDAMKKLFIILLSALSLAAFAQQPAWYNDNQRMADYPSGQYFTGFAEGQRCSGESNDAALKRIKDAARAEAASTIKVHVQNTTTNTGLSQTIKTMEGTFRQSTRELESTTTTSVDLQIPGLQVETWTNPANGTIAAFAWVKKSTLIRQLEKTITVGLTKIETGLEQIEQLIASGQKIPARDMAKKLLPQFNEVDEAQKLLAAVDENADEESLQLQETRTLQNRLTGIIAQLKNGIYLCIQCTAKLSDGSNYPTLLNEIKGSLSSIGCSFTSNPSEADWIAVVNVNARDFNAPTFGQTTTYFTYVEAAISIKKVSTGQTIYEDEISVKG